MIEKINLIQETKKMLRAGYSGASIVCFLSDLADIFIKKLLSDDSSQEQYAIFAIGGYGRRELAPLSDIDIMFFVDKREDSDFMENIYYKLLDSGMPISHSFRTPDECIEESAIDIRTRTSLVDARFIYGNKELLVKYNEKVMPEITIKNGWDFFIKRKKEIKERLNKYGRTVYLLEPNLKESDGGLRDMHEALWISKVVLQLKGIDDLIKILSPDELKSLRNSFDFHLRTRAALHIVAGRRNDVLSYEYQDSVAALLGIGSSKKFQSSERLLRLYYLRAGKIKELAYKIRNIAASVYVRIPRNPAKTRINDLYSMSNNKIMVNNSSLLKENPVRILEAYLIYSTTGKIFTGYLRDTIKKNLMRINKKVRKSSQAGEIFFKILRGNRVYLTLKMMHDHGVLGRFIPEFGSVGCLVVHEPFHTYTVDEHSLLAIKILESLTGEQRIESPIKNNKSKSYEDIIRDIFIDFEKKEYLYLALLLHDIGKSEGKLHSSEGYKNLKYILDRFSIAKSGREVIEFLVRYHLLMSRTAFTMDIDDPEVIAAYADSFNNEIQLKALFLITYADMAAVNPEFSTAWKKGLMIDLYFRSLNYFRGIKEDINGHIKRITSSVIKNAGEANVKLTKLEEFLRKTPERYLLSSTSEKIYREFFMIGELFDKGYAIELEEKREGTAEITICAWDRQGLLSSVVGALSSRMFNIISLRTFFIDDGYVIDRIQISNWKELWWEGMYEIIEEDIVKVISTEREEKISGPSVTRGTSTSNVCLPFSPFIEMDNCTSDKYTLFETLSSDRIGLLSDITTIFSNNDIDIFMAKINTESEVAHDVFYVKKNGSHISSESACKVIKELWEAIL